MRAAARPSRDEAGFTLVELLASIAILGIISFALTEALILGFKTTDGTIAKVSRSAGVQLLEPVFTADVQRAERVWTGPDPSCAADPAFIRLKFTEQAGAETTVAYGLDPSTGGEQQLIRWSCTGGGAPSQRILGHFTHDPAGPQPISVTCGPGPCPDAPGTDPPVTVTLVIQTDPSAVPAQPANLTVRRRLA